MYIRSYVSKSPLLIFGLEKKFFFSLPVFFFFFVVGFALKSIQIFKYSSLHSIFTVNSFSVGWVGYVGSMHLLCKHPFPKQMNGPIVRRSHTALPMSNIDSKRNYFMFFFHT